MTDTAGTQYEFLQFVFIPRIHFGKAQLASDGSAWCSCTLESYIIPNTSLCYYCERMTVNDTEKVMELLAHARTVDTRHSSLFFFFFFFFRAPGNEARGCGGVHG